MGEYEEGWFYEKGRSEKEGGDPAQTERQPLEGQTQHEGWSVSARVETAWVMGKHKEQRDPVACARAGSTDRRVGRVNERCPLPMAGSSGAMHRSHRKRQGAQGEEVGERELCHTQPPT